MLPYRSVEYAWAEPLQKKELVIDVMTVGAPVRLGTVMLDKLGPSPPRRIGTKVSITVVLLHVGYVVLMCNL